MIQYTLYLKQVFGLGYSLPTILKLDYMFLTNRQKFNASTAKAIQITSLVVEWLLNSRNFSFAKLEVAFLKETLFLTSPDARTVETKMTVVHFDRCFELKAKFELSNARNFAFEWAVVRQHIYLTEPYSDTQVVVDIPIELSDTLHFDVYGLENQLAIEKFKKALV